MRKIVIALLVVGILVVLSTFMPRTGAEMVVNLHDQTLKASDDSVTVVNAQPLEQWGPQRYGTEAE